MRICRYMRIKWFSVSLAVQYHCERLSLFWNTALLCETSVVCQCRSVVGEFHYLRMRYCSVRLLLSFSAASLWETSAVWEYSDAQWYFHSWIVQYCFNFPPMILFLQYVFYLRILFPKHAIFMENHFPERFISCEYPLLGTRYCLKNYFFEKYLNVDFLSLVCRLPFQESLHWHLCSCSCFPKFQKPLRMTSFKRALCFENNLFWNFPIIEDIDWKLIFRLGVLILFESMSRIVLFEGFASRDSILKSRFGCDGNDISSISLSLFMQSCV